MQPVLCIWDVVSCCVPPCLNSNRSRFDRHDEADRAGVGSDFERHSEAEQARAAISDAPARPSLTLSRRMESRKFIQHISYCTFSIRIGEGGAAKPLNSTRSTVKAMLSRILRSKILLTHVEQPSSTRNQFGSFGQKELSDVLVCSYIFNVFYCIWGFILFPNG